MLVFSPTIHVLSVNPIATVVQSSPFVSPIPIGELGYFCDGFKVPQNYGATKDAGFQPRHLQQAPTWSARSDPTSAVQEKLHQAGQCIADGFLHMADLIIHQSGHVQKRYSLTIVYF